MPVYKWQLIDSRNFGKVLAPLAQIELQGTDGRIHQLSVLVDSGATVSLVSRSVGDLLGIQWESGRSISVSGVGGAHTSARVHNVSLRFANWTFAPVPMAIAENENVPNLLGRLGVFDRLQVDLDGTLQQTEIRDVWMNQNWTKIRGLFVSISQRVISRWASTPQPVSVRSAVGRFIRRGNELIQGAEALARMQRPYTGILLTRSLFELALQFEYLFQNPTHHSELYLAFEDIARYRSGKWIYDNPVGPLMYDTASSPDRPAGELRNKTKYDRAILVFGSPPKAPRSWFQKRIKDLASEVHNAQKYRWKVEYEFWYDHYSAWAHGDPMSTNTPILVAENSSLLTQCFRYYARMLLLLADDSKQVLSSDEFEVLTGFAKEHL